VQAEQERARRDSEVRQLEQAVQESERQLQLLGPMVDDLRASLKDETDALASLKRELEEERGRRRSAELRVENLTELVAQMEKRGAEALGEERGEREALEATVSGLKELVARAEGDLRREAEARQAAEARLRQMEQQLEANNVRFEEEERRLRAMARESADLEALVESKSAEVAERLQAEAALNARIQEMGERFQDKEAESQRWRGELRALQTTIKERGVKGEKEAARLRKKLDTMEDVASMSKQLSEYQRAIEARESRLAEIEQKIKAAVQTRGPEGGARAPGSAGRAVASLGGANAPEAEPRREPEPTPAAAPAAAAGPCFSVCSIPHPAKEEKGGEDAYFISREAGVFGVADGVSGWAELGVDPALYSSELMGRVGRAAPAAPAGAQGLRAVLDASFREMESPGSTTVSVARVTAGRQLEVASLGDSGVAVLRETDAAGWRVVWRSKAQSHAFNMPYQLSSEAEESDSPADAQVAAVGLERGDVVVAASDGLWDNMHNAELCAAVGEHLAGREGPGEGLAEAIGRVAARHAQDPEYASPFMQEAFEQGELEVSVWDKLRGAAPTGGKLDDITVVAARVAP